MSSDDDVNVYEREVMLQHLMLAGLARGARDQSEETSEGKSSNSGALGQTTVRELIAGTRFADHSLLMGPELQQIHLPVHRLVLAQSSPYFKTAFEWQAESTTANEKFTRLDPDLPTDLVTGCIGFCYAVHGVIILPSSQKAKELTALMTRHSYDEKDDSPDKDTLKAVVQLFEISSLMDVYKIASQWQIKQLQRALIYMLTPSEMHTDREDAAPLKCKCRAALTFSSCYDFYEAFHSDGGLEEFKQHVDTLLLKGLSSWKDGEHRYQEHDCSKTLAPEMVPFDQLEHALKGLTEIMTGSMANVEAQLYRTSNPEGMSAAEVTRVVLQSELRSLDKEKKQMSDAFRQLERQIGGLGDDQELRDSRRAISQLQNKLAEEKRAIIRLVDNAKEGSGKTMAAPSKFWSDLGATNPLLQLRSSVMRPESACALLDLLCAHYGEFKAIPLKYITLLMLSMDGAHLEQRLYPKMLANPHAEMDLGFWMSVTLIKEAKGRRYY